LGGRHPDDVTKIVEISADRICLYSRPPWWLVALFGAIFFALLFGLCPSYRLVCRRTEALTVDLRVKRQLLGFTLSERPITGVTGAEVQNSSDTPSGRNHGSPSSRGLTVEHNDTARIVFATQSGPIPLTTSYLAGREGFQNAAEELNQFLAGNRPVSRDIAVPTSKWIWISTLFFGLLAVSLIPGGWCRCVVDRTENVVRITWPTLLGLRQEEFALTDVESFGLVTRSTSVARRESEHQPQGIQEFVFAFKNFRRLQRSSFENSIGIRLHTGEEISITQQSRQSFNSRTEEVIQQLERLRRGEL